MNDHRDHEGVYALVTGAASGIRRTTAEALVRHGAEVIVLGRNAERGGGGGRCHHRRGRSGTSPTRS
jgi:NAD(P)-dependent dehydrogenase (short-subunit alcohol dehydrogenase family)